MRKFIHSFYYAGKGIRAVIWREQNFRFHLCVAMYVYLFSLFYSFGVVEYCILTILVGSVLALELVNSAIECAVGPLPVDKEPNKLDAMSKDMAAGAVLVAAIVAAVCGVFLFWNMSVFSFIFTFFMQHLVLLLLLILSLLLSYYFIFRFGKAKEKT